MALGRDVDDPGFLGFGEETKQEVCEVEMAEVVDHVGHFNTVLVTRLLISNHSRVVDEDIQMLKLILDEVGKLLDWLSVGQIKSAVFDGSVWVGSGLFDVVNGFDVLLLIPASDKDVASVSVESSGSFKSNSWITSSDDNILHFLK